MQRPLDHIGKDPLPPRRKTAVQRTVHRVLPQDARNPNLTTRPSSGVFCQINPTKPQCLLQHLARAIRQTSSPERFICRADRTIRPWSLPSNPVGKPVSTRPAGKLASTHLQARIGPACQQTPICAALQQARIGPIRRNPHRTNLPISSHQARRRAVISHAGDPSPFSRKLRARFPCGWQKPNTRKERP